MGSRSDIWTIRCSPQGHARSFTSKENSLASGPTKEQKTHAEINSIPDLLSHFCSPNLNSMVSPHSYTMIGFPLLNSIILLTMCDFLTMLYLDCALLIYVMFASDSWHSTGIQWVTTAHCVKCAMWMCQRKAGKVGGMQWFTHKNSWRSKRRQE
jgi:hypothetical protein